MIIDSPLVAAAIIDAAAEPVENEIVKVGTIVEMDTLGSPSCSSIKFIGCDELQLDTIVNLLLDRVILYMGLI